MQRVFSTGVSTIVALMAANRASFDRQREDINERCKTDLQLSDSGFDGDDKAAVPA